MKCPHCGKILFKSNKQSPCNGCQVGWSEYWVKDGVAHSKHCGDSCEMLKSYLERVRT